MANRSSWAMTYGSLTRALIVLAVLPGAVPGG